MCPPAPLGLTLFPQLTSLEGNMVFMANWDSCRCHTQSLSSDTQPLIVASSFRTLPRKPHSDASQQQHHFPGGQVQAQAHVSSHADSSVLHSQTLPLKSSLKKTNSDFDRNGGSGVSGHEAGSGHSIGVASHPSQGGKMTNAAGSMEELRV